MHTTKIVKTEQKSDEAIAVTVRCCDNPKTDSCLTLYGISKMSQEDVESKVLEHHKTVAAKCDGMQKATSHLANLATTHMEHN